MIQVITKEIFGVNFFPGYRMRLVCQEITGQLPFYYVAMNNSMHPQHTNTSSQNLQDIISHFEAQIINVKNHIDTIPEPAIKQIYLTFNEKVLEFKNKMEAMLE